MKHDHCEHGEVAYCGHCQVVYCKGCKKEWGECKHTYYPWVYTSPYTTTSDPHIYMTTTADGSEVNSLPANYPGSCTHA